MAVKKAFQEIVVRDTDKLEYTPPAGSGAIITDIFSFANNRSFITLKIGNRTVLYLQTGPHIMNQALPPSSGSSYKSLLRALKQVGLPTEFPVAEGEKILVQGSSATTVIGMHFKLVDPEDIKEDMPNGKSARERLIIIHGTNKYDITSENWYRLDKCLNPAEMHSWPFEEVACPYDEFHLYGLGTVPYSQNTYAGGADAFAIQRAIRIWKGTELLLHPNEEGFVTEAEQPESGSANEKYGGDNNELPFIPRGDKGDIFIFEEPLIFRRGDEMAVEVKFYVEENSGAPAGKIVFALVGKVVKPE
ncbi:MAG: hypothetical protein DRH57_04865 [Candidatus Cloacimonadota bacterium]|nr:MAG: hypothetical protein DRH57_04865 [Candidatus Cloacimonadota bacterium]